MTSPAWLTVLYISTAKSEAGYESFGNICKRSRTTNSQYQIGGALLFDGVHFGQILTGPDLHVRNLLLNIENDTRHTNFKLLFQDNVCLEAYADKWISGYCEPLEIARLNESNGVSAVKIFHDLLNAADTQE